MIFKIRLILRIAILIIFSGLITLVRINPINVNPTQSTETKKAAILPGLGKGYLLCQKLNAKKNYVTGIDLIFTHAGRYNNNGNTILLLDTIYNILDQVSFTSVNIKEGDYNLYNFKRPMYIGKGNNFYIALFSADATEANSAFPLMNHSDSTGSFTTSKLNPDNIIGSVKSHEMSLPGNLMYKLYESDYEQHWLLKIILYLSTLLLSAFILWSGKLARFLSHRKVKVEYGYLAMALFFSSIFAVITPPFSVPDEGTHFKLSYNISEFGMFDKNRTYPASIAKLDTSFQYLQFYAGNKITKDEILQKFTIKTNPQERYPVIATDYTLPYLPQAIGIFTGKLFSSGLFLPFYLGRFFNLILCSLLLFFALKIIPDPFKLVMLLLALMPKTVFLFGSLSYDSLTISLSFFAIAVFLYYACTCERLLNWKDLVLMGFLALLLLLIKPPYFLIAALFFVIPPNKFGKLYKFIMIGLGVVILAASVLVIIPKANNYLKSIESVQPTDPSEFTASGQPVMDSAKLNRPLFRPDEQVKNILKDVPAYFDLIYKSGFDYYREYLLKSFVGVLGYIDVELPDFVTYSYLILLLLTALMISRKNVRVNIPSKLLYAVLLVLAFVVIETAMYIYATRPGRDRVFGVQGRYFIPMAPLLFMILYNRWIGPFLNMVFSIRRKEYLSAKPKIKSSIYDEIQQDELIFEKLFSIALLIYCLFTLIYAVHYTDMRYYM
jgi:uncharacterized membrane protein